jgi:predicted porin
MNIKATLYRKIKPVFCLSLLACACTAQAQSSVTIYGILDSSVRYSSGLDAAYAGSATNTTAINSGVNTTSRFGFRGTEDLGGGLSAIFNLESGAILFS